MDSLKNEWSGKIQYEDDFGSEYIGNSDDSSGDCSDQEIEAETTMISKSFVSDTKINRRPTRRPDPNVFNRNALLARENRRKKKEYVETLERNIEKQYKINKNLQKSLRRQREYIKNLQNEKNYFKNILTNKSQIFSIVKLLVKGTTIETPKSDETSSSSLSPNSSPLQQPETSMISKYDDGDDYNLPLNNDYNSWDDLLFRSDTDIESLDSFGMNNNAERSEIQNNLVNDEHSYYSTEITSCSEKQEESSTDSGICLHISGGKLSLEFCASCHQQSKKPVTAGF